MRGVPVRIELGPRDIEENHCVAVSRHNREKTFLSLDGIADAIKAKLEDVRRGMYEKALANQNEKTYACTSIDEIKEMLEKNGDGFVKAMWCGEEACEDEVKALTGVGSRCIPFE